MIIKKGYTFHIHVRNTASSKVSQKLAFNTEQTIELRYYTDTVLVDS